MRLTLTRAWAALLALSAASTLISIAVAGGLDGKALTFAGTAILALAWAKAQIIAARYLGLANAPPLQRGFAIALALYMAVLLLLYLLG